MSKGKTLLNKQCFKPWQQVIEASWLIYEKRKLVNLLLTSHCRAFGRLLIKSAEINDAHRLKAQELFAIGMPVIAHNNAHDPCLIYANAAALQLWNRRWDEMIGMPSRLTAPQDMQAKRTSTLAQVTQKDSITGFYGVRIDSKGQKFLMHNVRIWTIWNEENIPIGQAATFANWEKIKMR